MTSLLLIISQILYVPVSTGVLKQVPLTSSINVMTDMSGTMQTPTPQVVIGGALLALPDQAIYQQAIADCQAGKVPPVPGPLGSSPSCNYNGPAAVNADIMARVKAALAAIPVSVLQSNNLEIIQ